MEPIPASQQDWYGCSLLGQSQQYWCKYQQSWPRQSQLVVLLFAGAKGTMLPPAAAKSGPTAATAEAAKIVADDPYQRFKEVVETMAKEAEAEAVSEGPPDQPSRSSRRSVDYRRSVDCRGGAPLTSFIGTYPGKGPSLGRRSGPALRLTSEELVRLGSTQMPAGSNSSLALETAALSVLSPQQSCATGAYSRFSLDAGTPDQPGHTIGGAGSLLQAGSLEQRLQPAVSPAAAAAAPMLLRREDI